MPVWGCGFSWLLRRPLLTVLSKNYLIPIFLSKLLGYPNSLSVTSSAPEACPCRTTYSTQRRKIWWHHQYNPRKTSSGYPTQYPPGTVYAEKVNIDLSRFLMPETITRIYKVKFYHNSAVFFGLMVYVRFPSSLYRYPSPSRLLLRQHPQICRDRKLLTAKKQTGSSADPKFERREPIRAFFSPNFDIIFVEIFYARFNRTV